MNMKYELAVAHRVCPTLAKVAVCYSDKLAMVRATAVSLARALNGIRTKLTVILDGCDSSYEKLFDEVFSDGAVKGVDYERIFTPAIGNHATYAKQQEILERDLSESEYLYFSEDDYIYRPNAFRAMMNCLKQSDVDFVTPLDHPDRYLKLILESRKVEIKVSGGCHWREIGTTCCTFMTKHNVFAESRNLLKCYGAGGCDCTLWLGLTKDNIFCFFSMLKNLLCYLLTGRNDWSKCIHISAWKYHHLNLVLTRKYRLWGPMPTLAVHLAQPSIPPFAEAILGTDRIEYCD